MLSKLLKYEFKATARKFLPLYGAILVVSLLLNLGIRFPEMELMIFLIGMVLFALFVSVGVITLMTVIKRFKDNLLSDEGYLMFTLPVSTEKLIFSKLITSIVWVISSGILGILSALLIMANGEFAEAVSLGCSEINRLLAYVRSEHIVIAVLGITTFFTQLIYFILLIYTSISISQIAAFNKNRKAASFIAFLVLYIAINFVIGVFFKNSFDVNNINNIETIIRVLIYSISTNLILCGAMFASTNYLLKNHLNIE
jgi:hypothetical protein